MLDGDELKNFTKVWSIAIASLIHCYYVVKKIPSGILRLLSLLPIFYLFITLPLLLYSILLGGPTTFYLIWLGNFKLLLLAFNQGPLSPDLPLPKFIATAVTPIKIVFLASNSNSNIPRSKIPGPANYAIKTLILGIIMWICCYREHLDPRILTVLYGSFIYLAIESTFAMSAAPVRSILGVEMDPLFNEPYLSTSLQDFWGRRWNLVVTSILRPTVYDPVRGFFTNIMGRQWSLVPAFMASFMVSGLMHEMVFYYLTRASPTWEVTWFFVLHGASTVCEVAVKKALNGRWGLHPAVAGPMTIGFVAVTASWWFFPPLIRNGFDNKLSDEYTNLARLMFSGTT